MGHGHISVNGITIWHETFGDAADPAVLLINGLGAQALSSDERFCGKLAAGGRFVIRYDNRDVGLSQWFDDDPQPYSLDDMARDAVGVLDALGIERAHVVGTSMGGMIAQLVALDNGDRVLTLTSMLSTPGGSGLEPPSPEVMVLAPPTATREERIEAAWRSRTVLAAGAYPDDDGYRRAFVAAVVDRAYHPAGTARQFLAVQAAPGRAERLRSLTVPTLVIHGTADPLIPYSHGVATAAAIPGARLYTVDGLGHEMPPAVWDGVIAAIVEHSA